MSQISNFTVRTTTGQTSRSTVETATVIAVLTIGSFIVLTAGILLVFLIVREIKKKTEVKSAEISLLHL
jgi:hypothetical protein